MNEFLAKAPFDLYELHLFHLVAEHRSFTKAGQRAGLTQSAITRQVRGIEDRLGISLFERTTRSVSLTPAGRHLLQRSASILKDVSFTLQQLQEDFDLIPKTIRIGFSRSIGLAYLPGFFFKFQREFPGIQIHVVHQKSQSILDALIEKDLDIGVLSMPHQVPKGLQITHTFADDFTIIAPTSLALGEINYLTPKSMVKKFQQQRWLLMDRNSYTGARLHAWLEKHGVRIEPAMEMDNFDLIINLVGLGLGISIVPNRALALYLRRRNIRKIKLTPKFSRKLVVITRKSPITPRHLSDFIERILF